MKIRSKIEIHSKNRHFDQKSKIGEKVKFCPKIDIDKKSEFGQKFKLFPKKTKFGQKSKCCPKIDILQFYPKNRQSGQKCAPPCTLSRTIFKFCPKWKFCQKIDILTKTQNSVKNWNSVQKLSFWPKMKNRWKLEIMLIKNQNSAKKCKLFPKNNIRSKIEIMSKNRHFAILSKKKSTIWWKMRPTLYS